MRKKLLILGLCLLLSGCKLGDIITGVGAGAMVGSAVIPPLLIRSGQVRPKDVLVKIDEAYKEYDVQVQNLMTDIKLTPKEKDKLIKEKTKVLRQRIKDYNRLLANAYGFPQELISSLSSPAGQEAIGELAKLLPPPSTS